MTQRNQGSEDTEMRKLWYIIQRISLDFKQDGHCPLPCPGYLEMTKDLDLPHYALEDHFTF